MKLPVNSRTARYRNRVVTGFIACATLMLFSVIESGIAAPEDEVRATFDRFVVAQNAHDIKAVEALLLSSPDFLWITRGTPIWGQEAALKRFAGLYQGTWKLDPEPSSLKVTMIGEGVAQVYVPIMFTIGAPGQPPQQTRFLMNQVWSRRQTVGECRASCPYLRLRNSYSLSPAAERMIGSPRVTRNAFGRSRG